MVSRDKVLEEALALPLADHAYLADVLEQRMAVGQFSSPEIGEA